MIHSPFAARRPGAAALIPGESGLVRTTLAGEAMIRSRGLGAVVWSNVGATAKGAQGVALSLLAQIGATRPEGTAAITSGHESPPTGGLNPSFAFVSSQRRPVSL